MSLPYELLKRVVGIFFNVLNTLLAGNLPPFACVSVLVEDQQRYLIIERPNGKLTFPGGFMRWHEYPEQTAKREFKEETGLELRPGSIIGYRSLQSQRIDRMSTLSIIYQGEVIGGTLKNSIEGQPRWLDADEIRARAKPRIASMLDDYRHHQQLLKVLNTEKV